MTDGTRISLDFRRLALSGSCAVALMTGVVQPAHAQTASADAELRAQVQALAQEVARLKAALEAVTRKTDAVDAKAEALATQQENAGGRAPVGAVAAPGSAGTGGSGLAAGNADSATSPAQPRALGGSSTPTAQTTQTAPAASGRVNAAAQADVAEMTSTGLIPAALDSSVGRASMFGYGEFNYNRPTRNPSLAQATVRRAVFGFGYRFNERLRFVSEIEFENAVVSSTDAGEAEIEQAYLDYAFSPSVNVKAGLFLIPIGILNEVHEPNRYYGVERNDVETRIIPTTWRELGVGIYGHLANGFYYDVGVTTSFNLHKWDAAEGPGAPLATTHGEGANAAAANTAFYGAVRYTVPGLRVGTGIFSGNSSQRNGPYLAGTSAFDLAGIGGRITLWDIHAVWQPGPWDLRALYARGTIGQAREINDVLSSPAVGQTTGFVPKSFDGWFVQAAYKLWQSGDFALRPFARYERYNLQRSMAEGYSSFIDPLLNERVLTAGVSFFVTPNAVIKADYQRYRSDPGRNRLNLGLGYAF